MTQDEALNIMKTGASVFLTGEPGSGKTHTVNGYVRWLRERGVTPAITASTGIAATHVGGYTIHSWSGVGVRRALSDWDLDRISSNRNVYRRVADAKILIIDEVSMLSERIFGMVDAVCREIRRSQEPFGGLQVILVGDFFQLPPVSRREESDENGKQETLTGQDERGARERFAFFSPAWQALNPLVCYLSEQYRQEDGAFLEFLGALRRAEVGERHIQMLRGRFSAKPRGVATALYSHNADVDAINEKELAKLAGEPESFQMASRGPEKLVAGLKRGCLSPEVLKLKTGARVMFTRNDIMSRRYVNGTIGEVSGFDADSGLPLVRLKNGRIVLAGPDEWRIEDGGRVLASITQVPLRLAWALTVHKSQGMSLDAAHVDLSGAFEFGQGYVALSRVRTLEGLTLAGLNKRALEIAPEILAKDKEFRALAEAARERFAALPEAELAGMRANFILACGGAEGKGRKAKPIQEPVSTYAVTKSLLAKKPPIAALAKERKLSAGTILSHLEKLAEKGEVAPERDLAYLKTGISDFEKIKQAFGAVYAKERRYLLAPVRAALGNAYDYDTLRLVRLFLPKE